MKCFRIFDCGVAFLKDAESSVLKLEECKEDVALYASWVIKAEELARSVEARSALPGGGHAQLTSVCSDLCAGLAEFLKKIEDNPLLEKSIQAHSKHSRSDTCRSSS